MAIENYIIGLGRIVKYRDSNTSLKTIFQKFSLYSMLNFSPLPRSLKFNPRISTWHVEMSMIKFVRNLICTISRCLHKLERCSPEVFFNYLYFNVWFCYPPPPPPPPGTHHWSSTFKDFLWMDLFPTLNTATLSESFSYDFLAINFL